MRCQGWCNARLKPVAGESRRCCALGAPRFSPYHQDGIPRKYFSSIASEALGKSYPRAAGELSTSSARRLAAVRVSTPSFSKISRTCFFTVDSLLPRIVAISPLVLP
jgi:hypothetical protein